MADLGTLSGSCSSAEAINNQGLVAGSSRITSGENHSFLWQDGTMIDLGTLEGAVHSDVRDMNESGQVIGFSTSLEGHDRGYLWDNGEMISLGTLGGFYSWPVDINEHGQVVGSSQNLSGSFYAFLWQRGGGGLVNLGTLPAGIESTAYAINDLGQIVGAAYQTSDETHPFISVDGVVTRLET